MQFYVPTSNGEVVFSPLLPRSVLKDSLKCLIGDKEPRTSIRLGAVYSCVYPRLYYKFRNKRAISFNVI